MVPTNRTFLKSQPKGGLTLREMFTRPLIYGTDPSFPKWSPDGKVLAFLWNEQGEPKKDLYVAMPTDAKPVKLTDAGSIGPLPVEDDERPKDDVDYAEVMYGGVSEFDWLTQDNSDEKWLVFVCRGGLYKIPSSGGLPIAFYRSSQGINRLQVSPDGRKIGFMLGANVWAYDTVEGSVTQLTFFAKDQVTATMFAWSPDSRNVAVMVGDQSPFETVKMPDYSPEKEVKIVELRRNNVGKPRAKVRFGIVPAEGGRMARIDIPDGSEEDRKGGIDAWCLGVCWTPDSSKLLIAYTAPATNRDWHLYAVEPGHEDSPTEICSAHVEPWADWHNLVPGPDSSYVYFHGYRTGWRRILRVSVAGGEIEEVTGDNVDITGFLIPKNGDRIFYTANAPDPREQQVFTLPLDGGSPTLISPILTNSTAVASDDGSAIALMSSGVMVPPELYILKDGKPVKVTSSPLPTFSKIAEPKIERFSFKNESDGATVYGRMMLPHNFDPSKKYPVVLTCVYAGQAKEGFGRYHLLDAYMANEMGYILVSIDLRASIGYGSDFYYGYYKSLGIIDAGECVSAAKHMQALPYVDRERIGIWGGSYGGFLVLMCMCSYPGVFHTGVSWKPVTDWRNYWDSYTSVRLDRPDDDPDIYKATSPVFHADKLEGNLLVVHGMLDDNVLFQDAVWMIQKLIESGKYFDLMIYPRDDHGLTHRHESLQDCMERFAAYFEEHMGLGPV